MVRSGGRLGALAIIVFSSIWLHAVAQPAAAQTAVVGVVKTSTGSAVVRRGETTLSADVGTVLQLGDELRTASDSSLGIALDDGTLLSIGQDSVFVLQSFRFAPSEGLFELIGRLLEGTLIYESGLIEESAPEKIKIETPYATVGPRGTRFALSAPRRPAP